MNDQDKKKEELIIELKELKQKYDSLEMMFVSDKKNLKRTDEEFVQIETEDSSRESDVMFKAIVNASPDSINITDLNGTVLFASPKSLEMYGYEKIEQIINRNFNEFIVPEDIERAQNQIIKMHQGVFDGSDVYEAIKADGTHFNIEVNADFIRDENGTPTKMILINRDVTVRMRVEEELRKSEEQYRNLIESVNDVIFDIDATGNIRFISHSVLNVLGYTVEEGIGQNIFSFVYPEDVPMVINAFKNLSSKDYSFMEYRYVRKDGSIRWVRSSSTPQIKDGVMIGATGTLTDVTEIKVAEELLKDKTNLLTNLIINLDEGVLLEDSNRNIVLTNQLFCNIFGIQAPSEALIGTSCSTSAEDSKIFFRNPEKFITDIDRILENKKAVFNDELELMDGRYLERDYIPTYIENKYNGHLWKYRDITERKLAEEKVRESEAKFRMVFENVFDGISIFEEDADPNKRKLIDCNEQYAVMSGRTREELLELGYTYSFSKVLEEDAPEARMKGISEQKAFHGSFKWIRPDGKDNSIEYIARPITWQGKSYSIGIDRDITDYRQKEDKLRKLSQAVEQSPVSIVITNLEGNIEYANPKACETTGYSLIELIGQNPRVLKSGETPNDEYQYLWDSISHGNVWRGIFHNKRKNGELYWESSQITPITDESGNITSYLAIKEDITERKKSQEELAKSEERFSQLTQQSKTVIWEVDPTGLYTYVSPLAEMIWGYPIDEIIGKKHFYDFHPAENREEFKNAVLESIHRKENFSDLPNQIVTKDNRTIWVSTNGIPVLDHHNNLIAYRGADNEITERVMAIEELRKSEERYKSIFQNNLSVMMIIDPETGDVKDVNASACDYYKWTYAELCNQNIFEINLLTKKEIKAEMQKAKDETRTSFNFKHRLGNGEIRDVEVYSCPIIFSDSTLLFSIVHDITDRIKAEEALKINEAALNQAQEISKMCSWELDLLTEKLTWSKNYYLLMGIPVDSEMSTQFFLERVHPEDIHLVDEKLEEMNLFKKQVTYDIRLRMPDNEYRWIQNNIVPEFDNEKLVGFKGVNIDVTEKKLAEDNIQRQNEKLNAIISAIPDLIFISDREGTYLEFYNANSGDLLYSEDQLIGSTVRDVFDEETANLHIRKIDECLQTKNVVAYDYSAALKGTNHYFEARLSPLGNDRVLRFVRDFTQEKQKDAELKKLYLGIEQSPVVTVITDLQANVEYVNPAFTEITGYSRENVIGKNVRILQSGKTDKAIYKQLWETIRAGKEWHGEWINKKKDGELYWENVLITPVRDDFGKVTNYLAVKQNITDRKQSEQEIHDLNANLEQKIEERTSQLASANETLLGEIEERKLADESLQRLSARLTLALRAGSFGVWDYDVVNNILLWDKPMFTIYGIREEDFNGAYEAWQNGLHPDDKIRSNEEMQMAIRGEKEFDNEFRVVWPDGSLHYIRALGTVQRDNSGHAQRVIGTNWDITLQKQAEKFENELLQLSPILTGLSLNKIGDAINQALSRIGHFLSADRSYIFEFDASESTMNNTHEWCNTGINPEIENLQGLPCEVFPNWMEALHRHENIVIPSVSDLPESWQGEREVLEPQGVQSVIVIPLITDGILIGFVGLDSVVKKKEYINSEINILKVWSSMLASLINNQRSGKLLEQTRQNYETFFNTIDDFLWVLDEQGNIIHTNNTVENRLEYTTEELLNQSVLMVHPADRRDEAGRIVGEMLAGTSEFCPVPIVTKSGNQIPVETKVKAGFWNGVPAIFGVSKDISQIQLSEQKFSSAFQSNSAIMTITRFDNDQFVDVNNAFLSMLGYSRDEIMGKTLVTLGIVRENSEEGTIQEAIDRGIPVREIEINAYSKSNDLFILLLSAEEIYIGSERCILSVAVDITGRKIIENELRKAREDADLANMAKSEFLSRMSHELRTPMNAILGFAQLMEMGELSERRKKGVAHILNNGRHLLDLINEVLNISGIEAGRQILNPEPVQLSGIINDVTNSIQVAANRRKVSVELVDSPSGSLYAFADRLRLKQVLINLLNNAVKYNREGGSVTIQTALQSAGEKGKAFVRISITDTGIGIKAANIGKLFQAFERLGAETTETEGTGLGLMVVKRLTEAMCGIVGVESEVGVGSTFWIELPLAESPNNDILPETAAATPQLPAAKQVATILYIEDNRSNIELVEDILGECRPEIHLVTSTHGSQTVNMAKKHQPDLILLDLNLPDISGIEVLEKLLAEPLTKSIPVVIISADAMPFQIEKLMKAGARDYLTKPLDVVEFLKTIDLYVKN
jgi:PAS domain S-box-containing protein